MAAPALERRSFVDYLAPLGLLIVAVVSLSPLLFEERPAGFVFEHTSEFARTATKIIAVVLLCLPLAVRDWVDSKTEPKAAFLTSLFLILAGLMTWWHAYIVDASHGEWQRRLYWDILNHEPDAFGPRIPHQYRPLPYGFVRTLEWITGDWWFSCVVYRWFFTFWFVWGAHRFARLFLPPLPALATLAPLAILYPFSVPYYSGQLTDPLSHALFVLALIYVVQDRWLLLGATLTLGIMAKETVILVVVSYYACYWRGGWRALLRTAILGAVCVAAYLAVRLPVKQATGADPINGAGFMIGTNLGIGEPIGNMIVPLWMNYLQPALFVGPFLPFIFWGWRKIDRRLRAIGVTLVPLLLLSNLCFGWMYESRNYMPLVPLLATMAGQALVLRNSQGQREKDNR